MRGREQRNSAVTAGQRRIIMDCCNGNSRRNMDVSNAVCAVESKQIGLAAVLPAMNALTACDYTSAICRKSKVKHLNILENNTEGAFVQFFCNESNIKENALDVKRAEEFECPLHGLPEEIKSVDEARYVDEAILNSNLFDDDDILRQVRFLYGTGNKLKYRFSKCSSVVKITLFRSYCTSFYASNLWCNYRSDTFRKLRVAYNDSYRILHDLPRYVSARECQVSAHVTTFSALIRKSLFSFVSRCFHSENKLISALMTSDVFFRSGYYSHYLDMV